MLICPNCYEKLTEEVNRCPHCSQFIIDDVLHVEFPFVDKKKCIFCGGQIIAQAKVCKHCHKWLDEVDQAVDDIDPEDLV